MVVPAIAVAGIKAGASLAGAGLGFLGSKQSSADQLKNQMILQAQAAKLNYEYSEKTARNSPTWNRAGLESAGYNPMLAVQNGTSGVNSNFTSTGSATTPDYSNSISQGVANAQSFQRLENETNMAETQAQKNSAETSEIIEGLPYVGEQAKANIQKTQAETAQFEATIENMKARLELDRQLGFMGLNVTQRGQNMQYNASIFSPTKYVTSGVDNLGRRFDRWLKTRSKK